MAKEEKETLDYTFIKKWKAEQTKFIKHHYPDIDNDQLEKFLNDKIEKNFNDPMVLFENNYKKKTIRLSLLKWLDWFFKKKPITTEHGVMFKQHHESINLSAKLLEFILGKRKSAKHTMFDCKREGDDAGFNYWNIIQKVYKIFANSYYGVLGQKTSIFYNLFTALSVTGKGQSIITASACCFENFLTNSVRLKTYNEFCTYCENIIQEEPTTNIFDHVETKISKKALLKYFRTKFFDKTVFKANKSKLIQYINNLNDEERARIYYKNNIFKFIDASPKVTDLVETIVTAEVDFIDVNALDDRDLFPEEFSNNLDGFWAIINDFVFYNHHVYDRVNRLKNDKRESVIIVDTDSNFLNIDPWKKYTHKKFKLKKTKANRFKAVNTMSYLLGNAINDTLFKFTTECNVADEFAPLINMKNEFLMDRVVNTSNKKSYASGVSIQEGVLTPEPELDMKGLQIKKSNTNKQLSKELQTILEDDIINSNKIEIDVILKKLEAIEKEILDSFNNGETTYSKPDKSDPPNSYKFPLRSGGVRGTYVWNELYPDTEIVLPDSFNTVKLDGDKLEKFQYLLDENHSNYEENKRIFDIIKNKVFDDSDRKKDKDGKNKPHMADYGVTVLAIPKSVELIPEWCRPLIKTDEIIKDNINNFLIILNSIGVKNINIKQADSFYSNIINF